MKPAASTLAQLDLPETLRYRIKNRLLGPPIATERQATERLGKPTALAVLSSDVISSSAYATEQMLLPLIPIIGVAAFSLVVPISLAVIFVLLFVTLSYLEVVKVYTKAGGAYVVARENFGLNVAQVAAMSLLIDYTLTVAVSVAAGVAAVTSVVPSLTPYTTWIAIGLVILLAYGNLRGIREAGRTFAVPTYFFIANMVVLISLGIYKTAIGSLHAHPIVGHPGSVPIGSPASGLLYGATVFVLLKAFASGGSALTGTEAISNGVSVFRQPESRNARITMVLMATILGSLVLGVSVLASVTHPVPYVSGTPTVISQVAKYVYGTQGLGGVLYAMLQIGTTLILILAANTSFTGFPFLASFAAEDSYLPRQLTKRGHRLVFSTGIIVLTVVSVLLLLDYPGSGGQPDSALRHRRVHRLHDGRCRDGEVSPEAPRGPLEAATGDQWHGFGALVHRVGDHRRGQVPARGMGHPDHPAARRLRSLAAASPVRGRGAPTRRGRGGSGRGTSAQSARCRGAGRPPGHGDRAGPAIRPDSQS